MPSRISRILLLAAACSAVACSRPRPKLPDVSLTTVSGKAGPSVASCPGRRCLLIAVAPWCGNCTKSLPLILSLRAFLEPKGVATRIVVGQDDLGEVRSYASRLGGDTLLDPSNALAIRGVPSFIVSDASGTIVNSARGMPGFVRNEKALAWYLGLP